MNIIKILYYAYLNTPNLYRSIFGYNKFFDYNYDNYIENNDIDKDYKTYFHIFYEDFIVILNLIYNFCFIKLPFHCPSWMPDFIRILFFGSNSKYIKNENELDENNNCFIYINGILGNNDSVIKNKNQLEHFLNKPVNLLINSSDTLLSDLIESLIGKETDELTEASTVAFYTITRKLLDEKINKIIVVAYSQGSIIIAKVLNSLHKLGLNKEKYLKKLEIYCFSNCASNMKYILNELPYIESFANDNDFVAKMGCNCPEEIKDLINIDGKIFINKDGHGHMLYKDYLYNFSKNYPLSRLNNIIKKNEK